MCGHGQRGQSWRVNSITKLTEIRISLHTSNCRADLGYFEGGSASYNGTVVDQATSNASSVICWMIIHCDLLAIPPFTSESSYIHASISVRHLRSFSPKDKISAHKHYLAMKQLNNNCNL